MFFGLKNLEDIENLEFY